MKTNKLLYHLGNILIAASLIGFTYIFFPILKIYLFPPVIQTTFPKNGTYITIPKINAQAPIALNIDPYDKVEYNKALKKSVAHAAGTSQPGEPGTSFLFAHSSGPPWELTRLNTIFLRLTELRAGDIIEIQKDGKLHKYKVRETKEVNPADSSYLRPNPRSQLILQTCTPIGTDLKRLLVFANPI